MLSEERIERRDGKRRRNNPSITAAIEIWLALLVLQQLLQHLQCACYRLAIRMISVNALHVQYWLRFAHPHRHLTTPYGTLDASVLWRAALMP